MNVQAEDGAQLAHHNVFGHRPVAINTDRFKGHLLVSYAPGDRFRDKATVIAMYGRFKDEVALNDLRIGTVFKEPLKFSPSAAKIAVINFVAQLLNYTTFDLRTGDRPSMSTSFGEAALGIWVRRSPFLRGPDLTRKTVVRMVTSRQDDFRDLARSRPSERPRLTDEARALLGEMTVTRRKRLFAQRRGPRVTVLPRDWVFACFLGNEFDFKERVFNVPTPIRTYRMDPLDFMSERDRVHYGVFVWPVTAAGEPCAGGARSRADPDRRENRVAPAGAPARAHWHWRFFLPEP